MLEVNDHPERDKLYPNGLDAYGIWWPKRRRDWFPALICWEWSGTSKGSVILRIDRKEPPAEGDPLEKLSGRSISRCSGPPDESCAAATAARALGFLQSPSPVNSSSSSPTAGAGSAGPHGLHWAAAKHHCGDTGTCRSLRAGGRSRRGTATARRPSRHAGPSETPAIPGAAQRATMRSQGTGALRPRSSTSGRRAGFPCRCPENASM